MAKFIEHKSSKLDDWHTCELGGKTLAKQVFDLKGEFFKSERIYKVNKQIVRNTSSNIVK